MAHILRFGEATMLRRRWFPVALVLLAGCSQTPQPPAADATTTPPTVTLGKPERRSLTRVVEQPGQVEALEMTPLFARVSGYVRVMNVDIGDEFKPGDALAEIDVPDLVQEQKQKAALAQQADKEVKLAQQAAKAAAAGYRSAAALAEEAKSGRERVLANVDRWRSEYKRMSDLAGRQVIDQQTRDETLNQLKSAEAALAEFEARVRSTEAVRDEAAAKSDKATADVAVAEARLNVARADEARVAVQVGFARLSVPYRGVVVQRGVDPGALVQPTAPTGKPLLVVARVDIVRVFVDVPEIDAVSVHPNMPAKVRIPALKAEYTGTVERTSGGLDPKSRTRRTAIRLTNDGRLLPGLFALADLTVEQPAAWVLPSKAIAHAGDAVYCYRVVGGKAVRVAVRIGATDGDRVQVLELQQSPTTWQPLTGKEELVVSDVSGLTDGQAVAVK